jgi:hypothetical protein
MKKTTHADDLVDPKYLLPKTAIRSSDFSFNRVNGLCCATVVADKLAGRQVIFQSALSAEMSLFYHHVSALRECRDCGQFSAVGGK